MSVFLTLTQQEIDPTSPPGDRDRFLHRRSARAVLLNEHGAVALLHATRAAYYKLPGGGIDNGESAEDALTREVREETGYESAVLHRLGRTVEYRDYASLKEDSACFIARTVGGQGAVHMEDDEIADGFEVIWAEDVDRAIGIMAGIVTGDDMRLKFLQRREVAILEAAKPYIETGAL